MSVVNAGTQSRIIQYQTLKYCQYILQNAFTAEPLDLYGEDTVDTIPPDPDFSVFELPFSPRRIRARAAQRGFLNAVDGANIMLVPINADGENGTLLIQSTDFFNSRQLMGFLPGVPAVFEYEKDELPKTLDIGTMIWSGLYTGSFNPRDLTPTSLGLTCSQFLHLEFFA